MPVYEYRCQHGHEYEKVEGFDAPTEHGCQQCGARATRRFSSPAVIFKGSGFYSTDNRKGSSGGNGGSGKSSAADSAPTGGDGGGATEKVTASE